MKYQHLSRFMAVALLALMSVSPFAQAVEADKKSALSAKDVDKISERIKQTGDQMRADMKKARAKFEAQEVERKQAAERARLQAIKDNEQRQAQKATQARERQVAAQAQAERDRQAAAQAKQLAEQADRKKLLVVAAQDSKETQAAALQARKLKAAEALKKARASTGVKAFGE